jgi:Acetyltransferase (GNAT) domain
MSSQGTIRYLKQEEINKKRWDECIDRAGNGLIYAYSFYLDHMADHWDGLVLNDYEAAMPLPWRKKSGIYYLYQPFLIAQLGLFGNRIDASLLQQFLKTVPPKFKLWEFPLNQQNLFSLPDFNLYERVNYVLPLNQSYELLYQSYRENIRRNIRKSVQYGCYAKTDIAIEAIIELSAQQSKNNSEEGLQKFSKLYQLLKLKSAAKTYGIFSGKDELLASCVFTFSHHRAYYILVGNHPNGRTLGASHALIDAFIKDHAEQNLLLDFEGSDVRNLAFFYSSFGAREELYSAIKLNKLPWYIKWMKD